MVLKIQLLFPLATPPKESCSVWPKHEKNKVPIEMDLIFENERRVATAIPLKQVCSINVFTPWRKLKSDKLDIYFIICIFIKGNILQTHKTTELEDIFKNHSIYSFTPTSFILYIPYMQSQKLYADF